MSTDLLLPAPRDGEILVTDCGTVVEVVNSNPRQARGGSCKPFVMAERLASDATCRGPALPYTIANFTFPEDFNILPAEQRTRYRNIYTRERNELLTELARTEGRTERLKIEFQISMRDDMLERLIKKSRRISIHPKESDEMPKTAKKPAPKAEVKKPSKRVQITGTGETGDKAKSKPSKKDEAVAKIKRLKCVPNGQVSLSKLPAWAVSAARVSCLIVNEWYGLDMGDDTDLSYMASKIAKANGGPKQKPCSSEEE